jgi:hypothetical protein
MEAADGASQAGCDVGDKPDEESPQNEASGRCNLEPNTQMDGNQRHSASKASGGHASRAFANGDSEEWWMTSDDEEDGNSDEEAGIVSRKCDFPGVKPSMQAAASRESRTGQVDEATSPALPAHGSQLLEADEQTNATTTIQLATGHGDYAPVGAQGHTPPLLPHQQQNQQQALIPENNPAAHNPLPATDNNNHTHLHQHQPLMPFQPAATAAPAPAVPVDNSDDGGPLDGYRVKVWRDGSRCDTAHAVTAYL